MLLLPTLLLALSPARAGGVPAPDIDGQRGFGPPVVAADGAHVAVTRWDRAGLWVWTPATGAVTTVTEARGAGFAPVWDDDALLFKTVSGTDGLTEQAVRWSGGITEVLDEAPILGQPTPLGAGRALWARRDAFRRSEPARAMTEHPVPGLGEVDLVVAHGETVAWDDDAGRLLIRDLPTGATRVLTSASPGSHPAWSDDGALLLHRTHQGDIEVLDVATGAVTARVQGMDPAWVPGTHDIVYARVETAQPGAGSPYTVVSDSLWTFSGDSGAQTPVFEDTTLHARHPTPIGDDLLFVDARGGDLYRWHAGTVTRVLVAPSTSPAPPPDTTRTEVIVPYLHQLWDTPDDFDGNWSCGPTSCVQTLSRWNILPNADITCSWPSPHTSHWGWYIPNNYNYAGYQYDIWGIDPQGSCQGAHGFICRSYGGAIWADMTLYMQQHGVDSAAVGTSYDSLINETSAGYPVYASVNVLGYGHILVMRGFLSENGSPIHSMIINDPYGNAGSGDWGNDDGEDIVYDWPGYNNGHLEIDVAQLFTAHGPAARLDTGSSTPVDTGNGGGSGGSSGEGSGGSSTGDTDTAATDSPPVRDTGPIVSGPLPGEPTTMLPDSGCSTGAPVRPLPLATALGALALTLSRRRRGPPVAD